MSAVVVVVVVVVVVAAAICCYLVVMLWLLLWLRHWWLRGQSDCDRHEGKSSNVPVLVLLLLLLVMVVVALPKHQETGIPSPELESEFRYIPVARRADANLETPLQG